MATKNAKAAAATAATIGAAGVELSAVGMSEEHQTPKERYDKLVPLLIAGAGYTKDEENKIQREALAAMLAGTQEGPAIEAFKAYNKAVDEIKAAAAAECGYNGEE